MPQNIFYNNTSGKRILVLLKSKFDIHYLKKINETKLSNSDALDHNKLRTYKTYKASFSREPYIDIIRNRNQRCFLTRLRVGSHNLRVELGRHTKPVTPFHQRTCQYCCAGTPSPAPSHQTSAGSSPLSARQSPPDTEYHFLMECPMFATERTNFFNQFKLHYNQFSSLNHEDKFKVLLCPVDANTTKLIPRFSKHMFTNREKYDNGV